MSCPCLALFLIASAFGPAIRQRTVLPIPRTRSLLFPKFPYAGVLPPLPTCDANYQAGRGGFETRLYGDPLFEHE